MDTASYLKTALNLMALAAWPVAAGAELLRVDDAVAAALTQNRSVRLSVSQVNEKKEAIEIAKSRRWPVMKTSAQFGLNLTRTEVEFPRGALGEYASTGPIPGDPIRVGFGRQATGFSYSQVGLPLTQQWRISTGIQAARLDHALSLANRAATEREVAQLVRRAYFTLVTVKAAQQSAAKALEAAVEVERLARQGVEQGVALSSDLQESTARRQRLEATAAGLRVEEENLSEQLNELMGRPLAGRFDVVMPALLEAGVESADGARERAGSQRPEVEGARLRIRLSETAIRAKKTEFIPDISLGVSHLGFLNTGNVFPSSFAVAGLQMEWEPWTWGRRKRELAVLRHQSDQARIAAEQAEQQVRRQAAEAFRGVQQRRQELDAAKQAVTAAGESLRIARQRYESQVELLRRVLDAQAEYQSSLENEIRAMAAAGAAWTDLQFAMGEKP